MPVSTKNNVKQVKENDEFNESQASLNFKTLAGNCKFGKDFLAKASFLGWRDLTSLWTKLSSCSSLLLYRRPPLSRHLRFTQHFHLSKHISIHQPRAPWTVLASLSVSALGSRWHRPWRGENAQLAGGGRGVFFSRWSSKCCGQFLSQSWGVTNRF